MPPPKTPPVTVDVIIEMIDRPDRPVVIVRRDAKPEGWALPGGFVDIGETVEAAAVREAREETGLAVEITDLLGVYSEPDRDPRGHMVSIVFIAQARGEPTGGDDAAVATVCDPENPPELQFDHPKMLRDYCRRREGGRRECHGD
jgi:8-oxo-dGTP diphosphatase